MAMRKTITRSMTISTINAFKVSLKDGKPTTDVVEAVQVFGNVTDKEALKAIQEKHGDGNYLVSGVTTEEAVYEISVEDFLKHATRVNATAEGSADTTDGVTGEAKTDTKADATGEAKTDSKTETVETGVKVNKAKADK